MEVEEVRLPENGKSRSADQTQHGKGLARYDAGSIQVISGLGAVRQRPAMYIGSTGEGGILHLIGELVQNATDEAIAGYCSTITVTAYQDGSFAVEDDGRGIPVDVHEELGRPACEVVLTTLHSGSKFCEGVYRLAGGLHGVGLACVNALSEWLILDIWRNDFHYRQRFSRGEVVSPVETLERVARTGTRVHFLPDAEIFGADVRLDPRDIIRQLEGRAFLQPGLVIRYENQTNSQSKIFAYSGGTRGLVEHTATGRTRAHRAPLHLVGEREGVHVDVALLWTASYSGEILAYANGVPTPRGGTHVDGLESALRQVMHRHIGLLPAAGRASIVELSGSDIREGLVAVVSVQLTAPDFDGQAKNELSSSKAAKAVEAVVIEQLGAYLQADLASARAILGRAVDAATARNAARRACERARYHSIDTRVSKDVYREQFGARSSNWHESAKWIADDQLLAAHASLCRVGPSARVLDACCGSGVVGAAFRGRVKSLVGLDLTPEMVRLARGRLDEVREGDVYAMPFPDEDFDLVVNREVLHLLQQPEKPLREIMRVLRPGGQFIVGQMVPHSDVDAPWMFRVVKKKQPLLFNNLTADDLRALLDGAGFVDIQMIEYLQWEDIDRWIDSYETPSANRQEIRDLYLNAPAEVRAVHPFEISASGAIRDSWRWCIFSGFKPRA